jgi:TetR/AcrR family transcriptional regulator
MKDGKARSPGRPRDPSLPEAILDLAEPIFAEQGFAGASLAELARRCGRSKAALLHHFASKEALYFAVIERLVADMAAMVVRAGLGDGSHADRLDQLGGLVVDYLGGRPRAAQLMLAELIGRGPYVSGPGAAAVRQTLGAIRDFLEAGMEAGELRRQDPEQLALSIVGIHLTWFGAHRVGSAFQGGDVFGPASVARRRAAVVAQVRALCAVD